MGEPQDDPPTLPLVSDGRDYALHAAPDGARFILRFKGEQMAADIVGEDAERFRKDLDEVRLQFPGADPDRVLAQLWDQGGYSWLAVEDG